MRDISSVWQKKKKHFAQTFAAAKLSEKKATKAKTQIFFAKNYTIISETTFYIYWMKTQWTSYTSG